MYLIFFGSMDSVIELSLGEYGSSVDALIELVDEHNLSHQHAISKYQ